MRWSYQKVPWDFAELRDMDWRRCQRTNATQRVEYWKHGSLSWSSRRQRWPRRWADRRRRRCVARAWSARPRPDAFVCSSAYEARRDQTHALGRRAYGCRCAGRGMAVGTMGCARAVAWWARCAAREPREVVARSGTWGHLRQPRWSVHGPLAITMDHNDVACHVCWYYWSKDIRRGKEIGGALCWNSTSCMTSVPRSKSARRTSVKLASVLFESSAYVCVPWPTSSISTTSKRGSASPEQQQQQVEQVARSSYIERVCRWGYRAPRAPRPRSRGYGIFETPRRDIRRAQTHHTSCYGTDSHNSETESESEQ